MTIEKRVDDLDWDAVFAGLDDVGIAPLGPILDDDECRELRELYDDGSLFRSTIDMARLRFGQGEYRYFAYPLPRVVAKLRASFWPHLLPIAREWAARLGRPAPWPDDFDAWLPRATRRSDDPPAHAALRTERLERPAPRPLRRSRVPTPVVIGLDCPERDYTGGEFVVVEQRPRPVTSDGAHDPSRTRHRVHHPGSTDQVCARMGLCPMRHGVSTLHSGSGTSSDIWALVFHDAE